MAAEHVFEVSAATFATDVVDRSRRVPVLLDFWADWCGPCRTLTPILEAIAVEYGGSFQLGKVDTQREPELAEAFQVRSIPFVVLLAGGRPVDAFAGALPDAEVRRFLARAGIEPAAARSAEASAAAGRASALQRAKRAVLAGDVASARSALAEIEETSPEAAERDRIAEGLALFEAELGASTPAAAAIRRGRGALSKGQVEAAMDAFMESVQHDRTFGGGLARKALLLCFAVVGEGEERVGEYRRRLATLLY